MKSPIANILIDFFYVETTLTIECLIIRLYENRAEHIDLLLYYRLYLLKIESIFSSKKVISKYLIRQEI